MILILLFSFVSLASSLSCLNEKGSEVDYWVALKQPSGTNYLYYEPGQDLSVSPYSMNDTEKGALTFTTKQLWTADSYVIFNDSPPGSTNYSFIYGHTKGYFGLNDDGTGFYLTHSIPVYPAGPLITPEYLGLGGNAYTYAQNLLCLSVSAETLDALSYKFQLNRPQMYDSKISQTVSQTYHNITNLSKGKYTTAAICADQELETTGGTPFTIFAKSTQWNNDLYDGCVSPRLQSDLWVESWIRGSAEGPDCPTSGYQTLDIQAVDFGSEMSWSETNDHSKWCVSPNITMWCMGDINRMTTQYERGGGTACLNDKTMYTALMKASVKTDSC